MHACVACEVRCTHLCQQYLQGLDKLAQQAGGGGCLCHTAAAAAGAAHGLLLQRCRHCRHRCSKLRFWGLRVPLRQLCQKLQAAAGQFPRGDAGGWCRCLLRQAAQAAHLMQQRAAGLQRQLCPRHVAHGEQQVCGLCLELHRRCITCLAAAAAAGCQPPAGQCHKLRCCLGRQRGWHRPDQGPARRQLLVKGLLPAQRNAEWMP